MCLASNGNWIMLDGSQGVPYVEYLTADDFDLSQYFREQGYTVVETYQRNEKVKLPIAIRNCVGFVKSILCIDSLSITPYGLYKYLRK